ncbi:imidazole glycerol phosphate synthase subunit HisH [Enterobacteriaceae endosymbiont of Plateumaris consimilis]|uniref:imidazole glycerol phosphate synthase subunit HisH n=1 Tax=Enterobacteriaceae endosymbiont of Plateumaris consimilis TaxID=2675794 RepID=UPI00144A24B4|nr:imidazole glycerol phosphate synthase subunit HisH [Enterobacteriaceae endosymbiont of Plateumaris consimilis]QJC28537.1 imidazole glycerol phosphate synthase subunit HisH [Enterobacteriaceae endosymbiont of Plateumaris consimilis]
MNIIIINTSCGNFFSLKSTIKKIGFYSKITNNPEKILNADKIFLPGVGSIKSAMTKLKNDNLLNILKCCKKDILGICLGMQLLGKYSQENKGVHTLGIFDVEVNLIKDKFLPIPHMGWNTVNYINNQPLFKNIKQNSYFYFAHSYAMNINNYTIAYSNYVQLFSSVIQKNNFFGVQFHPERSGINGIQLIKNFLEM